ncbi:MAG: hypothetical protein IT428_24075 [Planctomycetaceae bacterium]|nr:hypothetical protein [Planctomycetaceae bacterium]
MTLEVGPLTEGRPRYQFRGVVPDQPMETHRVDNLLELRAPYLVSCYRPRPSVTQQIQDQLDFLILYGPDVLRGDFSVFPEIERLVKARGRKQVEEWVGVEKAKEWGWDAW